MNVTASLRRGIILFIVAVFKQAHIFETPGCSLRKPGMNV
jgi:hypothetical protein